MTDLLNENGRAVEFDAPDTLEQKSNGDFKTATGVEFATPNGSKVPTYIQAGYELIRLHVPNALDKKGREIGKAPIGRDWRSATPLTTAEAVAHMQVGNVGVRLRAEDLVIDVDPRNFQEGDDPLARLEKDLGYPLRDRCPTVETGSGGLHLYLRKPPEALRETLEDYQGIEFKSVGRQVVAAGSVHPATGKLYEFDPLADDLSAAPMAPETLLFALAKPARAAAVDAGGCTPEKLGEMLQGLNAEDFKDHHRWLELMMACHHATAGEGRDEFIEWSTSDPQFSEDAWIIGRRWDSLHTDGDRRVTERTLLKELNKAGRPDLADAFNRTPAEEDFGDADVDTSHLPVSEERDVIDRLNESYAAVKDGGKFAIFEEAIDYNFKPPRPVLLRLSKGDFLNYHEDELMRVPGSRKDISVAEHWLRSPRRRKYSGVVLDPDGTPPGQLNLWKGWAIKPKAGNWSMMRELIEKVLCSNDQALAEYVLRWMAFMFQKPGVLPGVALAFRGEEGTGKGTLGRALMAIAGHHGMTVSSTQQFAGRFNAHLRTAAFLFADEVDWREDRSAESRLKQLVTEPVIAFEGKGVDSVQARNIVHLLIASNNEWVVPAGTKARRFVVSDVSEERRGDDAFFDRLNRQLDAGGYAAMLHDLLAMDLGDWRPSKDLPQTQALAEQKAFSLEPPARFWMGLLDKGALPVTEVLDWDGGSVDLSALGKNELLDEYDRFLKANRLSARASHKALVVAGRMFGLLTRKKNGVERQWLFPPLAEARRQFEKSLGATGLFDN